MEIIQAGLEDLNQVRELFREYADLLGFDLCFQGFEQELATLPGAYALPTGRLLIARDKAQVGGCVALRKFGEDTCEMKRMFLRPAYRGQGIGRRLAQAIIAEARRAGYTRLLLDTVPVLQDAITLYHTLGFKDIAPYYHNPLPGARYMELVL